MAISIAKAGGIGVIHRNLNIKKQIQEIRKVKSKNLIVGAAVGAGVDEIIRAEAILKEGVVEQAETLTDMKNVSYYKIPVIYEIKGNFLGYIKFKRALAKSKKMLNFDKEIISIVQNDSTGAIIAKGELTIVGLPDEFF